MTSIQRARLENADLGIEQWDVTWYYATMAHHSLAAHFTNEAKSNRPLRPGPKFSLNARAATWSAASACHCGDPPHPPPLATDQGNDSLCKIDSFIIQESFPWKKESAKILKKRFCEFLVIPRLFPNNLIGY